MKKIIKSATCSLLIALSLVSTSCKKNVDKPVVTNTAVISLNGAQPSVDSVRSYAGTYGNIINEIDIYAYLNHNSSTSCKIVLLINPSDPLYATGAVVNLATSLSAAVSYLNGADLYADYGGYPSASGVITITKNDVAARRIEGIFSNCTATKTTGNASVSISGTFAVTYIIV